MIEVVFSKSFFLFQRHLASTEVASRFDPWIYTVIGAICGTLLVLFLVFSFLTYRNQRVSRRRHQFDLEVSYLRTRSFSGSVMSENNNSYVPEPTFQMSRVCNLHFKVIT